MQYDYPKIDDYASTMFHKYTITIDRQGYSALVFYAETILFGSSRI